MAVPRGDGWAVSLDGRQKGSAGVLCRQRDSGKAQAHFGGPLMVFHCLILTM